VEVTWKIESMTIIPVEGTMYNLITSANWSCTGVKDGYSRILRDKAFFEKPKGRFTPYDELKEEDVLKWVWGAGNVKRKETERRLKDLLDAAKTAPEQSTTNLPWS